MDKKIDFLIIGAQKSGTTWLSGCLKEHPGVYIPDIKEVHYFDNNYKKGESWYHSFFKNGGCRVKGEATPKYMFKSDVPGKIYKYKKDIKLITILRNPTTRAISQYKMEILRGGLDEGVSLIHTFNNKISDDISIKDRGFYSEQLKRYFDLFDENRLKILLYDDIIKKPKTLIKDIYAFLEVDDGFLPDGLNKVIKPDNNLFKIKNKKEIIIKKEDLLYIKDAYAIEIEKLEKMLNIDLSDWK